MNQGYVRRHLLAFGAGAAVVLGTLACARSLPLLHPSAATLAEVAPDSFQVEFRTTRGTFQVLARRHWAPHGADRFHLLVRNGFYDGSYFDRVVTGYVAMFGVPTDSALANAWADRTIPDDPVVRTNRRGTLAFARSPRPHTRTTAPFINLVDNPQLDTVWTTGFPVLGEVVAGMEVVDSLYAGYGERAPRGSGPTTDSIRAQGVDYLRRSFPRLDRILTARVVRRWP